MAKNPELVSRLEKPIKRDDHKGYFLYPYGYNDKDGLIVGIFRSKIMARQKKDAPEP